MQYALLDESGRPADRGDRIITLVAIVAKTLVGLDKIIPKVKKKIPSKRTKLAEIKFSTTGEKTRIRVLKEIADRDLPIYTLVIDKEGRKIFDTPENYSLLVAEVLRAAFRDFPEIRHIIIDRHFTWVRQREKFNELLQRKIGKEVFIEHLDSQQNTVVSLPDFVAGAVRTDARGQPEYKEIISKKVRKELVKTWREIKKVKA